MNKHHLIQAITLNFCILKENEICLGFKSMNFIGRIGKHLSNEIGAFIPEYLKFYRH